MQKDRIDMIKYGVRLRKRHKEKAGGEMFKYILDFHLGELRGTVPFSKIRNEEFKDFQAWVSYMQPWKGVIT